MPMWDYECSKCGKIVEIIIGRNEENDKLYCGDCGAELKKLFPNKGSFKLVYNNKTDVCSWGNEGYASSQYWSAYRKEKNQGKDVKPVNI